MAKDKKGFILYADLLETVNELSTKDAGELFKHILEYVNDLNPTTTNPVVKLVFIPIKQHLKRDLKKFEARAERSKINGKKGGRPKTQETQRVISEPRKPDTVNDNDNDNVKDKVIKYRSFDHLSISVIEYNKLCEEWEAEQVEEVLNDIENYKKNTNYKSLYLTARKWLGKHYPKQQTVDDNIEKLKKYY